MNPRPQTLEELVAAPPGTPVCDMHDGLPTELSTGFVSRCPVSYELARQAIKVRNMIKVVSHGETLWLDDAPDNKIAYKIDSTDDFTTLAYLYDGVGWFLTIEH